MLPQYYTGTEATLAVPVISASVLLVNYSLRFIKSPRRRKYSMIEKQQNTLNFFVVAIRNIYNSINPDKVTDIFMHFLVGL